ncbi:hypothetical protein ABIF38_003090 [Bradyrhizobium japonicum]|uniref:Uncharacterized protein n=1 Tax=Bradyrhizobium elkanii TaxID=29448 RepID=A0ABV4FCD8_BRAEL|nr:hypothetical protein [Bradyrhizobium elkanii]MCP1734594.1 hypothetical protein [Bradyrhizobium elkanii]MCP1752695.1 hypothetical protein [Bradyrhizobium elkanii]MCP1966437.1 hypothetical protein [Bradyrhizobium elkanii]MCS3522601.1 hypothetical protein [Bradyrhizobium elkanii]
MKSINFTAITFALTTSRLLTISTGEEATSIIAYVEI